MSSVLVIRKTPLKQLILFSSGIEPGCILKNKTDAIFYSDCDSVSVRALSQLRFASELKARRAHSKFAARGRDDFGMSAYIAASDPRLGQSVTQLIPTRKHFCLLNCFGDVRN